MSNYFNIMAKKFLNFLKSVLLEIGIMNYVTKLEKNKHYILIKTEMSTYLKKFVGTIDKVVSAIDSKIFFIALYLEEKGISRKLRFLFNTNKKKIQKSKVYIRLNYWWTTFFSPPMRILLALIFSWVAKLVDLSGPFFRKLYPLLKEQAYDLYSVVTGTIGDFYYEYEDYFGLEEKRNSIQYCYDNRNNFLPWLVNLPKRTVSGSKNRVLKLRLGIETRVSLIKSLFQKDYWIEKYSLFITWLTGKKEVYAKYRKYTKYDWWMVFFRYNVTKVESPKSKEQLEKEKILSREQIIEEFGPPVYQVNRDVGLFFVVCNRIFDGLLIMGVFYVVCYRYPHYFLENLYFLNTSTLYSNINIPFSASTLGYMYHWQIFLIDSFVFWREPISKLDADYNAAPKYNTVQGRWLQKVLAQRNDQVLSWMSQYTRSVKLKKKTKTTSFVWLEIEKFLYNVGKDYPTFYDQIVRLHFRKNYELVTAFVRLDLHLLPDYFFNNSYVSLVMCDFDYFSKIWNRCEGRRAVFFMVVWEDISGVLYLLTSVPYFIHYTISLPWLGKSISYIGFNLLEESYYRTFCEYLKSFRTSVFTWGPRIAHNEIKLHYIANVGVFLESFSGNKFVNWVTYIVVSFWLGIILFVNWYFYLGEYIACFIYLVTTTGLAYISGGIIVVGTIVLHNFFAVCNIFIGFWDVFVAWVIAEHIEINFWTSLFFFVLFCVTILYNIFSKSITAIFYITYELCISSILLFYYLPQALPLLKSNWVRLYKDSTVLALAETLDKPKMFYKRVRYVGRGARYFLPNSLKHYRYLPRLWYGLLSFILFYCFGGYTICIYLLHEMVSLVVGDLYMMERSPLSGIASGTISRGLNLSDLIIYKFNLEEWQYNLKRLSRDKIKYKHGVRKNHPRYMLLADFGDTKLSDKEISVLRFRNKHAKLQILRVKLDPPYRKIVGGILENEKLKNWVSDYTAGYVPWALLWDFPKWPEETRRWNSVYVDHSHWFADIVTGFAIPLLFSYTCMSIIALFSGIPLYTNDKTLSDDETHKSYSNFYLLVALPLVVWFSLWFGDRGMEFFLDPSLGYLSYNLLFVKETTWTAGTAESTHSNYLTEYQTTFLMLIE